MKADVSFLEDARLLSQHGKLNGVLHAAGVLRDAVLHKQTAGSFREVLAGKVSFFHLLHYSVTFQLSNFCNCWEHVKKPPDMLESD